LFTPVEGEVPALDSLPPIQYKFGYNIGSNTLATSWSRGRWWGQTPGRCPSRPLFSSPLGKWWSLKGDQSACLWLLDSKFHIWAHQALCTKNRPTLVWIHPGWLFSGFLHFLGDCSITWGQPFESSVLVAFELWSSLWDLGFCTFDPSSQ